MEPSYALTEVRGTFPGGTCVVGYHPRKIITYFRTRQCTQNWGKGYDFLVILTNLGKDMTDKLRITHAKTRILRVYYHT